jgi:uncharacterized RDD family membrane protein YckC
MSIKTKPARTAAFPVTPPEGVPIGFNLATYGARFGAQFMDILITYLGAFLFFLVAIWLGIFDWNALGALFALVGFFLRTPYYVLSELVWNGRTFGKKVTGIRVISQDGRRLTPHQIVARNILKEVEIFLPFGLFAGMLVELDAVSLVLGIFFLIVVFIPVFHKRKQRLGDMLAGTVVVDQPKAVLLPDLALVTPVTTLTHSASGAEFLFRAEHLDIYGRYELQVLEDILRNPPKIDAARDRMVTVARTIHRKTGFDLPLPQGQEWDFLVAFYRQQREYLESRQLFGDTREDKHRTAAKT